MSHPLEAISGVQRKKIFWLLFVMTLVVMVLMNLDGAQIVTEAAPSGIVSFELAGSTAKASAIIASWGQRAQLYAAFGLGFDYVFMLAYAATISLACLWAADVLRAHGWPMAWLGVPLAWGVWLAAALDAIENLALGVLLLEAVQSPWPAIARWCATFKFALVFLGLVYAFLGLAVYLVSRLLPRQSLPSQTPGE
jgi:hypothetical protein